MNRRWEIDALRGLMLVLMTLTHLPTRLSDPLGQPFGFVTAAEGIVLLSAYMAARVYAGIAQKQGIGAMHQAFWRRALKLYGCHALLLLFLFNEVVSIGLRIDQLAVKNLASFYLAQPLTALLAGLALVYEPPLLDILPMYILFMLASPWVLAHALHHGWRGLLATSIGLWVLAQTSATAEAYTLLTTWAGIAVPYRETGSFVTLGWQFLWMLGLWMGAGSARVDASPNASNLPKTPSTLGSYAIDIGPLIDLSALGSGVSCGLGIDGIGLAAFD